MKLNKSRRFWLTSPNEQPHETPERNENFFFSIKKSNVNFPIWWDDFLLLFSQTKKFKTKLQQKQKYMSEKTAQRFIALAATVFISVVVVAHVLMMLEFLWCGLELTCFVRIVFSAIVPLEMSTPQSIENSLRLLQTETSLADSFVSGLAFITQMATVAVTTIRGDVWLAKRSAVGAIGTTLCLLMGSSLTVMRYRSDLDGAVVVYLHEMTTQYVLLIAACLAIFLFSTEKRNNNTNNTNNYQSSSSRDNRQTTPLWSTIATAMSKITLALNAVIDVVVIVLIFSGTTRVNELTRSRPIFPCTSLGGFAVLQLITVFESTRQSKIKWLLLPGAMWHVIWCLSFVWRLGTLERTATLLSKNRIGLNSTTAASMLVATDVARRQVFAFVGLTFAVLIASATLLLVVSRNTTRISEPTSEDVVPMSDFNLR